MRVARATRRSDLRAVVWNIRHGGGPRRHRIAEVLVGYTPDLVVLTEYRAAEPTDIIGQSLAGAGLAHQYSSVARPGVNGILVATRTVSREVREFPELEDHRHRLIEFTTEGVRVLACYFPQGRDKEPVFRAVLDWAARHSTAPALILGDLNTGKHRIDEAGSTFVGAHHIDELEQAGFTDAWRHHHGQRRDYSWFSPKGNGFRVDHVFASQSLLPALGRVEYSHRERENGVSDHSLLVIEGGLPLP